MTLPGTTRTVTVPPTVGMITVSGVTGVEVEDDTEGVVEEDDDEDDGVPAPGTVVVGDGMVEMLTGIVVKVGAATLRGGPERSPTRSSAVLTICQVRVVVTARAANQAPIRRHCLIPLIVSPPLLLVR